MTVRQLLSHTAGFEGNIFTDTGTNDDAIEKYVATLATDPQLFAPGVMYSYNNAGFVVLGRIIEVLRGKPYNQALREHLFAPLGLEHAATDAASAILFRAAVGHLPGADPDDDPVPAPMWSLVMSNAPAGSALAMRPRDLLLAFAAMHLNSGKAADGTQVLSAESAAAMRAKEAGGTAARRVGHPVGARFRAVRFPRRVHLRPRRRHHRPRARSCGSCQARTWRSRCSPTAATRSACISRSTGTC